MKLNYILTLGIAIATMALTSCSKKMITESSASYATFNISCLHSNGDGTETVMAWGQGKDYQTAAEAARRNAVREMIFKGITSGSTKGCNVKPIVPEVNAQEKYSWYFDKFFANGGAYTQYVSKPTDNKKGIRANKSTGMMSASVEVTVNRSALRQRLIDDEILKP
ncbi:MAG: hypothetical protein K2M98_03985 [Muribaculum sp.]|nr:hypothetical protein [Muribaculum sp.]